MESNAFAVKLVGDSLWMLLPEHQFHKQRIWLAIDETTREIVGLYVGEPPVGGASLTQPSKCQKILAIAISYLSSVRRLLH